MHIKFTLPLTSTLTRLLVYPISTNRFRNENAHGAAFVWDFWGNAQLEFTWLAQVGGEKRLLQNSINTGESQQMTESFGDGKTYESLITDEKLFGQHTTHPVVSLAHAQPVCHRNEQVDTKLCHYIFRSLMSFYDSAGCHFHSFSSTI